MRPLPNKKTIAYTGLEPSRCPVPHCQRPQRRVRAGLCRNCKPLFNTYGIAMAGFLPSGTLTKIANKIIAKHGLNPTDIREALMIARGTRHRIGPWEDRPVWRLTPLLHGNIVRRRAQLLVGRRFEPKLPDVVKAMVHHILIEEVLEAGPEYARILCGKTFFATRGLYCAKGQRPDVPEGKPKIFRLNNRHFGVLGTIAIKSCKRAGLDVKDHDLRAEIVSMYLTGREAGEYRDFQYPPRNSIRSAMIGDHPLDFLLPDKPWVPQAIRDKTYRAGGTVRGEPVELPPMQGGVLIY